MVDMTTVRLGDDERETEQASLTQVEPVHGDWYWDGDDLVALELAEED